MRKLSIFALTAATVIAASGSTLSLQASAGNSVCEKLQKDNCVVMGGTINNKNDLEDILSQIEKEFGNCKWNYCVPNIIVSCPGFPGTNQPEIEKPEDNKPETELPDIEDSKPEVTVTPTPMPEDTLETTFAEQVVKLVNQERIKAGEKPKSSQTAKQLASLMKGEK